MQSGRTASEISNEELRRSHIRRKEWCQLRLSPNFPGTNEIITLTGTRVIASNPELLAEALLGGLEKAAWPLAAGATLVDVLAHINCGSSDPIIEPPL